MKNLRRYLVVLGLYVYFLSFSVPFAGAHGTAYRVLETADAVTAEFFYDDGEPMQYAKVLVFSPQDKKVEYQNGRTDRQGRFAFYPENSGTWRIEVKDGMGHLVKGIVEIAPDTTEQAQSVTPEGTNQNVVSAGASKSGKVVFGLSLLLNIGAVAYFWKNRTAMKNRIDT